MIASGAQAANPPLDCKLYLTNNVLSSPLINKVLSAFNSLGGTESTMWIEAEGATFARKNMNLCESELTEKVVTDAYAKAAQLFGDRIPKLAEKQEGTEKPVTLESEIVIEKYWQIENEIRDSVGSKAVDGKYDSEKLTKAYAIWGLRWMVFKQLFEKEQSEQSDPNKSGIRDKVTAALYERFAESTQAVSQLIDGNLQAHSVENRAKTQSPSEFLGNIRLFITVSIAHALYAKGRSRDVHFIQIIDDRGAWFQRVRLILAAEQITWFRIVTGLIDSNKSDAEKFIKNDPINDSKALDGFLTLMPVVSSIHKFFFGGRRSTLFFERARLKRFANRLAMGDRTAYEPNWVLDPTAGLKNALFSRQITGNGSEKGLTLSVSFK